MFARAIYLFQMVLVMAAKAVDNKIQNLILRKGDFRR